MVVQIKRWTARFFGGARMTSPALPKCRPDQADLPWVGDHRDRHTIGLAEGHATLVLWPLGQAVGKPGAAKNDERQHQEGEQILSSGW
jgi:hypothetical protein